MRCSRASGSRAERLTIGTGGWGDVDLVTQRPPGLGFTHRVAAGGVRREYLGQKSPERHQGAKEPLAAGAALWLRAKQRVGNHRAEGFAQCRDRIGFRQLTLVELVSGAWRAAKEQRAKSGKEGSRERHLKCVYLLT
jgi:hypothetical protein